jgi:hypothetical protein
MKKIFGFLLIITFYLFVNISDVDANLQLDTDHDGVSDKDELAIYKTDINNPDSDGDGYSDWLELNAGYSPLNSAPVKLEDNDYDGDGLSDKMELNFHTDLSNIDTDGDGFLDGDEIDRGYDPNKIGEAELERRIDISIYAQKLFYFLGGVLIFDTPVSSGIYNTTPRGEFTIHNKHPNAWSSYGLWMPYWMAITANGKYGIHELPVWPNGYREGEDHLGTPVSHGCVRVGTVAAEKIYNLTKVGTPVFIY